MTQLKKCIYCLVEKDDSKFDRDHVMPEAFGRFDTDNLVLSCVCRECNKYCGDNFEIKLARDSAEGFFRVNVGLKTPEEFRFLKKGSTTRVTIADGPYAGAIATPRMDSTNKRVEASVVRQVGFAKQDRNDPTEWFLLGSLPTKSALLNRGYISGKILIMPLGLKDESDLEEILIALECKGFDGVRKEKLPPIERIGYARTHFSFSVRSLEMRAIAKIALNYVAAVESPAYARMPQFNEVRSFVRFDVTPSESIFDAEPNTWRFMSLPQRIPLLGHYVSVQTIGQSIVAQVCLNSAIRYFIFIARGGFALHYPISKAHFFHIRHPKRVVEMPAHLFWNPSVLPRRVLLRAA